MKKSIETITNEVMQGLAEIALEQHNALKEVSDRLGKLIEAQKRSGCRPERKRGTWILQEDKNKKLYGWHICSECGAWLGEPTNYCSECGADMRGDKKEQKG